MIGGLFVVGLVAGAVAGPPGAAAEHDTTASLQQCYREVRRACGENDAACTALGVFACRVVLDDSERSRASAGANLRQRVLRIGAGCPSAGATC